MFLELDACIHDGWLHFPKISQFTKNYLYQLFLIIREELVRHGSGSVFTNLKTDILKEWKVTIPSNEILETFDNWMETNLVKLRTINYQSQTLAKLRDVLLPKLISGELRIPQAEKMVEDAVA
jgi:type I restriction enzyme S subunit